MIGPGTGVRVYLACGVTDMRKGIEGLAALAQDQLRHALAQVNLGFLYVGGRGVTQDQAEASKWFHAAAEQGYAGAQSILGNSYKEGLGVPQNYHEAVRWYRAGAEQGHARAQRGLGTMYSEGLGVPQDYNKAYLWLNLAVANGDVNGVEERDEIAAKLPPEALAAAQARASACISSGYKDCD